MQRSAFISSLPRRGTLTQVIFCSAAALFTIAVSLVAAPSVGKNLKIGAGLYEVAVSESTNTVYVASTGADNTKIFILDGDTLEQKGTIDVGENAAFGIALNDKTQTLYTSNTRAGNVGVIDLKTKKVVKVLKPEGFTNGHVFRVLVDEDSNMVYVTAPASPSQIWIIDGSKNEIVHVIPDAGATTTGVALNPAAKLLYAVSRGSNEILVFKLGTYELVKKIPSGGKASTHAAFDAKTNRLFVTNQEPGDITAIDVESGKLLGSAKTGETALGIQFNPSNNMIYVANRGSSTVSVIDAKNLEVVAQLQAGSMPNTVAFNRKTNVVYVTNKARRAPSGKGKDKAAAPAAPFVDELGDTVTLIKP